MLNKRLNRILGLVIGVMVFMTSLGVGQVKALADDNVNTAEMNLENTVCDTYKDYSVKINKSVEQNGFKITLDSAIVTKHDLKVVIKVESEKPFDENKYDNLMDSIVKVTFGVENNYGVDKSYEYLNDKTLLITIEKINADEEYLQKGNLIAEVVMPNYKINAKIDSEVDFSKSFKNIIEKDIFSPVPQFDFTLNKVEFNVMGTRLNYSGPYRDFYYKKNNPAYSMNSFIILKIGDKMYKAENDGCYWSDNEEKNRIRIGSYSTKAATYERIKDENYVSIIPVTCNMSCDEINKIFTDKVKEGYYEKREARKETTNNVKYLKSFKFSNGSKGEIYNIERNDNKFKIYCRGNSEKESLLMASNINISYNLGENDLQQDVFYKDPNDKLGYVVEFSNVPKDKTMDVNCDFNVSKIDKFEIGNEVIISK